MSANRICSSNKERNRRPSRSKRSSVMRPVLRLEVQPILSQNQGFANKRSRSQRNVARLSSNEYDHLRPARRSRSSNSLLKTDTFDRRSSGRSGRSDCQSVVVVQYIDNGHFQQKSASVSAANDDADDYDHLFPLGEYEHLCDCTYARVLSVDEEDAVWEEPSVEGNAIGNHFPTCDETSWSTLQRPRPLPSALPYRRAKSIDTLVVNKAGCADALKRRRQVHSISDSNDVSHWSLGESVMKTLTESGLQLFNIEHPTHESEIEVTRTWPKLKSKLEMWRQSQQTDLNCTDEEVCPLPKMDQAKQS